MATIRFVATQVLSSDDGLSYKTEDVESEEARKARLEKERNAQGRTLWEQLEEQKARKKEEYDAVTKQIFAPTKALDEEEAAYLEGVRQREESREKRRAAEEERELAAFAIARANRDLNHLPTASAGGAAVASAVMPPPAAKAGGNGDEKGSGSGAGGEKKAFPEVKLNVKIKRKEKGAEGGKASKKQKKAKGGEEDGGKKEGEEGKGKGKGTAAAAAANPLAMLASYGSDDEEED